MSLPREADVARQLARLHLILATAAGREALARLGYAKVTS